MRSASSSSSSFPSDSSPSYTPQRRQYNSADPSAAARVSDKTPRTAWGTYYLRVLNAPPFAEWESTDGDGTISILSRQFNIPPGSRAAVRRVISDAWHCLQEGEEYVGELPSGRGGQNTLIKSGSPEEKIVANSMESGRSLRSTTLLVNKHLRKKKQEHVGMSSVHSCYWRLDPVVTAISKRKQGSNDPDSPWAKARYGWCLQLLTFSNLGRFEGIVN